MARQLKRWESPRKEGRNHKGKGGSARQRQRRKQFQMLRQRLKSQSLGESKQGEAILPPLWFMHNLQIERNAGLRKRNLFQG